MKRYQNPEIFEPLAMAYALGTLQGRARKRFEKLMSRHFYLRVVAQAYEQQFAGLVGLLPPEEPSPAVWKRLEQELGIKSSAKRAGGESGWLMRWLHWPAMALASVAAAVITVLLLNNHQPHAYFARLDSSSSQSVAMAAVSKDDMKITVSLTEAMPMGGDVMPTLWCFSKKSGEMPIRMGSLKPMGQSELSITHADWAGLDSVGKLAISLEPMGHPDAREPMGDVIYTGELMRGE